MAIALIYGLGLVAYAEIEYESLIYNFMSVSDS